MTSEESRGHELTETQDMLPITEELGVVRSLLKGNQGAQGEASDWLSKVDHRIRRSKLIFLSANTLLNKVLAFQ